MAYNTELADRVRKYLGKTSGINVEEKKMFGGLAFLVNGKMCVNISGGNLMCRFDRSFEAEVSQRDGYQKMVMNGREYKGYCYVNPAGFETEKDFRYWLNLCLDFNEKANTP